MGELVKLKIKPFSDPGYTSPADVEEYSVMINPPEYIHTYKVEYSKKQAPGAPGATPKFNYTGAQVLNFNLTFDGTGAIPDSADSSTINVKDVDAEISKFKKVVYAFNGEIHSPNYIQITWGKLLFKGRLSDMTLTYTFFKPDGSALRATAKLSFISYVDADTLAKQANKKSPDLTRITQVVAGDTLPNLCYKYYGDSAYYIYVARYNNLDDFRNITPGKKIYFPPLQK